MEAIGVNGLTELCRLCGEVDKECFDLFDEEGQGQELLFKINLSVRLAIVQNDGLPSGICSVCQDKLLEYTAFYQQCHDTQDRLQEFISIESCMQKSYPEESIKYECEEEVEEEIEDSCYYEDAVDESTGGDGDDAEGFMEVVETNTQLDEKDYILPDMDGNTAERSLASNQNDREEDREPMAARGHHSLHPSLTQLQLYESLNTEEQMTLGNSLGISLFDDAEKSGPSFRKEMDVLLCGESDTRQTVPHLSCCSEPRLLPSPSFSLQGEDFALDQGGGIPISEFPLQEEQQLSLIKSVVGKEISCEVTFTNVPSTRMATADISVENIEPEAQQLQNSFEGISLASQIESSVAAEAFAPQMEKPLVEQTFDPQMKSTLVGTAFAQQTEQRCATEAEEPLVAPSLNPQVNVSNLNQELGSVPSVLQLQASTLTEVNVQQEPSDPTTVLSVNASVVGATGEIKFQRNMGGVKIVFPPTTADKIISSEDLINLFSLNEVRQAFCAESKEEDIIQQLVQQGLGSEGVVNSGRASSLSLASSLDLPNSLLSPLSSVCDSWSWEISQLLSDDENSNHDGGDNRSELNTPIVTLPPRPSDNCNFNNLSQYARPPCNVVNEALTIPIPESFDISANNVTASSGLTVPGSFGIPDKNIMEVEASTVPERFAVAANNVIVSEALTVPESDKFLAEVEALPVQAGAFGIAPSNFQMPDSKFISSGNRNISIPQRVFTPLQVQIPDESDSSSRMSKTLHSCNTYFEEISLGISPVLDLDPNVATVRVSCPPTENSQHSLYKREFGITPPIQTVEQLSRPTEPSHCIISSDGIPKDIDCDIKEVSVDIIIDDGKTNWLKLLPDPTDEFIKKISHKCYKCHICLKSFRFKFQVQRHIKTNHSTEKPFICAVCGATFSIKYYLTRHMKLHDSNNKFQCKDCNRKFNRRYLLLEHEQSHKAPLSLKCADCGKQFSCISAFKEHKSICPTNLQSYICDICGKTYPGKTALNHHRIRHESFRKFKCTMCESAFHTQWQLVKHTKRHASQGLYVCRFCSLAFNTTTNLKKHMSKCPALTVNKIAKENPVKGQ